jgi:hypothetical protein
VQILENEGEITVEGPQLELNVYLKPLRMHRLKIGIEEKPEFANIGDYWNDETMEKIADLLCDYQDLFPTTFSEMRGILGELGEMKIPLNLDAKPVKQSPYKLNLVYAKKVKANIDMMLEDGIIEPITQLEWISPMVVQDEKTGGIKICVDLRKLKYVCLHDPF